MEAKTAALQLLTLKEAENLTGRKVAAWRKDIRERQFPYVTMGRQIRVKLVDIQRLIEEGYHPSVSL